MLEIKFVTLVTSIPADHFGPKNAVVC